ncbi:unnamed protein product, partial [Sphacelaria rigidula]
ISYRRWSTNAQRRPSRIPQRSIAELRSAQRDTAKQLAAAEKTNNGLHTNCKTLILALKNTEDPRPRQPHYTDHRLFLGPLLPPPCPPPTLPASRRPLYPRRRHLQP